MSHTCKEANRVLSASTLTAVSILHISTHFVDIFFFFKGFVYNKSYQDLEYNGEGNNGPQSAGIVQCNIILQCMNVI